MDYHKICQRIEELGKAKGFDPHFSSLSEDFWLAKEVLFNHQYPEKLAQYQQRYPIMSTFEGDFPAFQEWYAKFCIAESKKAYQNGSLPALPQMGQLKKGLKDLCPEDHTIYPLREEDMPGTSSVTQIGGQLKKITLFLPNGNNFELVAKKYPQTKKGRYLFSHEEIQELLAKYYDVAEPQSISEEHLILTYPKLKGDLSYIVESSDEEKVDAVKEALQKSLEISFDFYNYLQGKSPPSSKFSEILQMIRNNEQNTGSIVQKFFGSFVSQSYRLKQWGIIDERELTSELREELTGIKKDGLTKRLMKEQRKLAKRISKEIPKYPIHNDFFVGNILVDRRDQLMLHDFRLALGPLQNDVFDLLESINLDEKNKYDILEPIHQIAQAKAREKDVPLFSLKEFKQGYNLVRAERGLRKAALFYRLEKGLECLI